MKRKIDNTFPRGIFLCFCCNNRINISHLLYVLTREGSQDPYQPIQEQEAQDVSFYNPASKVFIMAQECDWYLYPRPFLYIYKQLI